MARAKDDLSKVSLNQIETLTGATFRSIKKWLAEAGLEPIETTDNSINFDPREALPIVFEQMGYKTKKNSQILSPSTPEDEAAIANLLDPFVQRARKDRAQANKAEFELDILRRKYILADEVRIVWSNIMTNFRVKLMSFTATEPASLVGISDPKEIRKKLQATCRELLEELSVYDPESDPASIESVADDEDDLESGEEEGSAADFD